MDSRAVANVPMELARDADRRDAAIGGRRELMLILDGFGFIAGGAAGGVEPDSFTGGAASTGLGMSSECRGGLETPSRGAAGGPGGVDKVVEVFSAAMEELDGAAGGSGSTGSVLDVSSAGECELEEGSCAVEGLELEGSSNGEVGVFDGTSSLEVSTWFARGEGTAGEFLLSPVSALGRVPDGSKSNSGGGTSSSGVGDERASLEELAHLTASSPYGTPNRATDSLEEMSFSCSGVGPDFG